MKIAYFCEPQFGGTYTFFLRLRPKLAEQGIELRCVVPISVERFKGSPFEAAEGLDFLHLSDDLALATSSVLDHLQREHYDLVMVLPASDLLSSSLPRYLPRTIRCVMNVPMMTRGAYAPTRAMAPHLDRIYAVSDRIGDDLVQRYQVPKEQVKVIYHGVDPALFPDALDHKSTSGTLNLLYAGRLWDIDKGVFLLPEMMRWLCEAGADVHLTVAGGGPDGDELKRRFEKAGVLNRVTFAGVVSLDGMNDLYRAADVFVFPSRFEGCGFAALEAMAAGCAPVVSDIRGSLRVLMDDGACGHLARVGDARSFARAIRAWSQDRAALRLAQENARARILSRFTLDHMANCYADDFKWVLASEDKRLDPIPLTHYEMPTAFRATWRTKIPRPLKNFLRTWLERFGISS